LAGFVAALGCNVKTSKYDDDDNRNQGAPAHSSRSGTKSDDGLTEVVRFLS